MTAELDADAAALLAEWAGRSTIAVEDQPLEVSRNSGLINATITGAKRDLWSVTEQDVSLPGCEPVPVRVYRPDDRTDLPVLVYSHGGGWTLLSIESADVICREFALGADCVVVSVGYRLAPEHPFPAAFDDVWNVVRWVADGGVGWRPPRLALSGDSAGGNLSAAVSMHARDTRAMTIDFQLLLYPSTGLDLDTPSMRELGPDPRFRLTPSTMRWFWRNYLGPTMSSDDPRAVPMLDPDCSRLPATLVATAGFDPLRSDGERYAARLAAAGVEVEHLDATTLPHGFAMMLGAVPAARAHFDVLVGRLRDALHPLPTLAREFRDRPFGRHSAELQLLLHQMRSEPIAGKPFLFMSKSQEEWVLGRYDDSVPPVPVVDWDVAFSDLEDAEWHVFKHRWRVLFGDELDDGDVRRNAPRPSQLDPFDRERVLRSPAVLGYATARSVRAGEQISFCVSSAGDAAYFAHVVRLLSPDIGPIGPSFRQPSVDAPINGTWPGTHQPILAGSYAHIAGPLPIDRAARFEVLVQPTLVEARPRTILEVRAEHGTVATVTHGLDGLVTTLRNGDTTVATVAMPPLRDRAWTDVSVAVDLASGTLSMSTQPLPTAGVLSGVPASASTSFDPGGSLAGSSLWLAASAGSIAGRHEPASCFTGKLERVRVFELTGATPVAEWDFSLDMTTERILDIGPSQLDGTLHNMPTRGTRGSTWSGQHLSWVADPTSYAAIHFHDDDLADAGWPTSHTYDVPGDLPSGCYALRLQPVDDSTPEWFVPFVVRPRSGDERDIAYVIPTTTYGAYANMHLRVTAQFNELAHGRLTVLDSTDFLLLTMPELGKSTYDVHRDGSPVIYSSMNRPVTNFRPTGRMYKFCEDLMTADWLDAQGFIADVITDDDLHVEGAAAFNPYRVAITGTHPEYLTRAELDAFEAFTGSGGRLMYLGGNGFYSAAEIPTHRMDVTEVRRPGQDNLWRVNHAEGLFSTSGLPGGLWRNIGRSENATIGVGFITQGFDECTWYTRSPASREERVSWVFDGVGDERIGNFGILQGGAAGYEIDRHDVTKGSPPHSVVLASSGGHSNLYDLMVSSILDTLPDPKRTQDPIRADMVFFETDNGGAVFSVGSIAWAGSLSHDGYENNVSRITGNVLRRFIDPTPFPLPG